LVAVGCSKSSTSPSTTTTKPTFTATLSAANEVPPIVALKRAAGEMQPSHSTVQETRLATSPVRCR
jgi:hypothetical protein